MPQELYEEYRWRQWQYTNRARLPYRRYVEVDLQGDYFYDLYGNYLTQGWLVFNTAQTRPQEAGSTLFKTNVFDRWFNQLVIAGDRKGQYHYALTVSNNLRTTLTPLAFSKPRLNGFQLDLATDKYQMTFLAFADLGGLGPSRRRSGPLRMPRLWREVVLQRKWAISSRWGCTRLAPTKPIVWRINSWRPCTKGP